MQLGDRRPSPALSPLGHALKRSACRIGAASAVRASCALNRVNRATTITALRRLSDRVRFKERHVALLRAEFDAHQVERFPAPPVAVRVAPRDRPGARRQSSASSLAARCRTTEDPADPDPMHHIPNTGVPRSLQGQTGPAWPTGALHSRSLTASARTLRIYCCAPSGWAASTQGLPFNAPARTEATLRRRSRAFPSYRIVSVSKRVTLRVSALNSTPTKWIGSPLPR